MNSRNIRNTKNIGTAQTSASVPTRVGTRRFTKMPCASRLVGPYRFPAPLRCRTAARTRQRLALQPHLAVNSAPRHSSFTNHTIRPVSPDICNNIPSRHVQNVTGRAPDSVGCAPPPLHPAHYLRTSWLEVRPSTSDSWGLGCWVCRQAKFGNDDGDVGGPLAIAVSVAPTKLA